MNHEQRRRFAAYAKEYAPLFVDGASDDVCIERVATKIEGWVILHRERGDEEKAMACELSARELRTGTNLKATVARTEAGGTYMERCFLGRWGASGCPTMIPRDMHWASSMVGTNIGKEMASLIRCPWPAFAIELPPGLRIMMKSGDRCEAEWIGVAKIFADRNDQIVAGRDPDPTAEWVCMQVWDSSDKWILPAFTNRPLAEFGEDIERIPEDDADGTNLRALKACAKIVLGCLMAVQSGQAERASARSIERRARNGRFPSEFVFAVGVPVEVRMVDFVREYVRVGPRKMTGRKTVQSLVRGHWKNQPHGPGATERKFIHIEPYWRGPEDAPIPVRPHILKAPKKKPGDDEGTGTPNAAE